MPDHNLRYFYVKRAVWDREFEECLEIIVNPDTVRKMLDLIKNGSLKEVAYALIMPIPEVALTIPNKIKALEEYIYSMLELLVSENYCPFNSFYVFYYDDKTIITLPCNEFLVVNDDRLLLNGTKPIDKSEALRKIHECEPHYGQPKAKIHVFKLALSAIRKEV